MTVLNYSLFYFVASIYTRLVPPVVLAIKPWPAALGALVALAVAMGIGRFAFTPILPMMQDDGGLELSEGAWLASANYLGYLLGALAAMRSEVEQRLAIRFGLIAIALTTMAMAFTQDFGAWILLRALPGFASAWVLVYVSAWSLEQLGKAGRSDLSGTVYAGVGAGIVFAGLICLALSQMQAGAREAWLALGLSALLAAIALWPLFDSGSIVPGTGALALKVPTHKIPEFWRLVFCYGAFGFGYIIPATFLPVMAKQIVPDPLSFGWAWPVFGTAAVLSTLLAATLGRYLSNRRLWVLANLVMALGILVPIFWEGLAGIVIAALCVGGTFMVNTMMGLQEAKRVGRAHGRLLMAAMTSAFAAGQVLGPLLVNGFMRLQDGFTFALSTAALPLVWAACTLLVNESSNDIARADAYERMNDRRNP